MLRSRGSSPLTLPWVEPSLRDCSSSRRSSSSRISRDHRSASSLLLLGGGLFLDLARDAAGEGLPSAGEGILQLVGHLFRPPRLVFSVVLRAGGWFRESSHWRGALLSSESVSLLRGSDAGGWSVRMPLVPSTGGRLPHADTSVGTTKPSTEAPMTSISNPPLVAFPALCVPRAMWLLSHSRPHGQHQLLVVTVEQTVFFGLKDGDPRFLSL